MSGLFGPGKLVEGSLASSVLVFFLLFKFKFQINQQHLGIRIRCFGFARIKHGE